MVVISISDQQMLVVVEKVVVGWLQAHIQVLREGEESEKGAKDRTQGPWIFKGLAREHISE